MLQRGAGQLPTRRIPAVTTAERCVPAVTTAEPSVLSCWRINEATSSIPNTFHKTDQIKTKQEEKVHLVPCFGFTAAHEAYRSATVYSQIAAVPFKGSPLCTKVCTRMLKTWLLATLKFPCVWKYIGITILTTKTGKKVYSYTPEFCTLISIYTNIIHQILASTYNSEIWWFVCIT